MKNIIKNKLIKSDSVDFLENMLILKKIPIFEGLSKNDYHTLKKILHFRKYHPEEFIFKSSTPGLGMYIIIEGDAVLSGLDPDGNRIEISQLSIGESFGEISLVSEDYRSTDAIAVTECKIVSFFRPDLLKIITLSPKLGNKILYNLATILGDRLIKTNKLLISDK